MTKTTDKQSLVSAVAGTAGTWVRIEGMPYVSWGYSRAGTQPTSVVVKLEVCPVDALAGTPACVQQVGANLTHKDGSVDFYAAPCPHVLARLNFVSKVGGDATTVINGYIHATEG
jgi:hypothetical protein